MGNPIAHLAGWAVDVIEKLGYVGLFLILVLENIFPPIPSEAVLPLAGYLTGQGDMNIVLAVLVSTAGAVVGALILYFAGDWFGEDRFRRLIRRYGKWLAVTEADFDAAGAWFDRRGNLAVLICRCVPVVRSIVSIPAGIRRMPLLHFVVFTAIGSAIWNSILIGLGWIVGENWDAIERYADLLQYVVIVLVLAVVTGFVWKRKTQLLGQFLKRDSEPS